MGVRRFDVFGMCNAIFDVQCDVGPDVLAGAGLVPGTMRLVDRAEQASLLDAFGRHVVNSEAGGAGANTMIGLGQLGARSVFTSRVGDDAHGREYAASLHRWGVQPNLGTSAESTGVSLIAITPDAQRTMNTHLGASRTLSAEHLSLEDLGASGYLYVTGYLWDTEPQKAAVTAAMRHANSLGIPVAFSLADLFCVDRHKSDFNALLDAHVDVVIANADEAKEMTGIADVREAAVALARRTGHLAVVTMDRRGSLLVDASGVEEIPAFPVDTVDTTGAGDMYAAGILYGLVRSLDRRRTGLLASWLAAKV
ncbi:MAG: adenosine kinase, partial [Armatimonadota bacterium]